MHRAAECPYLLRISRRDLPAIFRDWCLDHSRTDRDASNSLAREVECDPFRHDYDAALRRLVGTKALHSFDSGAAGGIDDHAAAALDHVRDGVLASEEHAFHAHVHHPIPYLFGGIDDVLGHVHTGIVVEDVDAAECAHGLIDHPLDFRADAHIDGDRFGGAAGAADFGCGVRCGFGTQVGGHHLRA